MAGTTIGIVFDRINSLVALQGFIRTHDAFDFDREPSTSLDATYRVSTERSGGQGYLHSSQLEEHDVEIWVARRVFRDPHGAHRQLKADMDLIELSLYADDATFEYNVLDDTLSTDCRLPGPEAGYVTGRIGMTIDFDRAI